MTAGRNGTRTLGFTLVEVVMALAILLIVLGAAVGVYATGFRSNSRAMLSTEASQVLAGIGAQITQHQIDVAAGSSTIIVYAQGPSPQAVTVSPAPTSCDSYLQTDRKHLCATVTNVDAFDPTTAGGTSLLANPMRHYNIRVCWAIQGGKSCADANTLY